MKFFRKSPDINKNASVVEDEGYRSKDVIDYGNNLESKPIEVVTAHLLYAKSCYEEECKRESIIEQKASQILSQSSIAITVSLIGVPAIIKVFSESGGFGPLGWEIIEGVAAVALLLGFVALIRSILSAKKTLETKIFAYPDYRVVFGSFVDKRGFEGKATQEYLEATYRNLPLTNEKMKSSERAQKHFRQSLILLASSILVLYVCLAFKSTLYKKDKVSILTDREKEYVFRAFEKYLTDEPKIVYLGVSGIDSVLRQEKTK